MSQEDEAFSHQVGPWARMIFLVVEQLVALG